MSLRICRASDTQTKELGQCPRGDGDTAVVHPADLHAWAAGDLRLMAALRLLDDSRLLDHPWTATFIDTATLIEPGDLIFIDFAAMRRALPQSPLSGGERALAQITVSLAERQKIDLGQALIALDSSGIDAVLAAIETAADRTPRPRRTPEAIRPGASAPYLAVGA